MKGIARLRAHALALLVFASLTGGGAPRARADDGAPPVSAAPEMAATAEARGAFLRGTDLARRQLWSDALGAFEAANRLRPHPVTQFNVGRCRLALGHVVLAWSTFREAKAASQADPGALDDAVRQSLDGMLAELDRVIVRVAVDITPREALISIDGRPLAVSEIAGDLPIVLGSVLPPGPARVAPAKSFELWLDPGPHVISVAHPGFAPVALSRTFAPGARERLPLSLDLLPARVRVQADQPGSAVAVDDVDVGIAPIELTRPAGAYRVLVRKAGHVSYATGLTLKPGDNAELSAVLPAEHPTLTQRWWFWTAIGVVVAGVATTTYVAVRSSEEPARPPVDGGGLGWAVPVP